jgi:hypothetical protein
MIRQYCRFPEKPPAERHTRSIELRQVQVNDIVLQNQPCCHKAEHWGDHLD